MTKENESLKEPKINKTKKYIPKSLRSQVWNKYIGQHIGEHECYIGYGIIISQNRFECGHVISEKMAVI